MTDSVIEKIYALADAAFRNGHPFFRVHIFPFRMTAENILQHADSQWMDFWRNLKEGYDYFEQKKMPPNVTVRNYNYKFQ
jgi:murein L,D-transpeptidase YafK